MNQLQLDTDEVILFEKEKVKRESNKSYFGDFVLTNKKIIFIQKGIFGGIKKIDEYFLRDLKIYNGEVQAKLGKDSRDHYPTLDLFFTDGTRIAFCFETFLKTDSQKCISEINKVLIGNDPNTNFHAIPGVKFVADTLKDTADTIMSSLGISAQKNKVITMECPSCSAKLIGKKGTKVKCSYCDTETIMQERKK